MEDKRTKPLYIEHINKKFDELIQRNDNDGAALLAKVAKEIEPAQARAMTNQLPQKTKDKYGLDFSNSSIDDYGL